MPGKRPDHCKQCGRSAAEVELISRRGLCLDCGELLNVANMLELKAHSGPAFEHWRRRIAASVGAELEQREP